MTAGDAGSRVAGLQQQVASELPNPIPDGMTPEEQLSRIHDHTESFFAERVQLPGGASVSRFEMLLATKEHELQHRAQLTVIQRMLGLVPHFTRALPPRRARAA